MGESSMEKTNIVFIVLDACRAYNLSCYGYNKPTSPNIDNIAKEGVLFEHAFSTTNITDPSLTTIFSGYYPTSHGMTKQAEMEYVPSSRIKFLPEILKSHGYTTMAVDWLSRWHKRGYDWYGYQPKLGNLADVKSWAINVRNLVKFILPYDKIPTPIKSLLKKIYNKVLPDWYPRWYDAKKTTDVAMNLIEKNKDKRFFLFIHYWDTHTPYNAPNEYWEKFYEENKENISIEEILGSLTQKNDCIFYKEWLGKAKDINEVLAWYDGSIAYVDNEIGRLYDYLEKKKILDNTILIITSDHGECLLEHGIFFDHRGALYDEVLRVPLIIRFPKKLPQKLRIKEFVQHVDILPTLLELLGIYYESNIDGKSILPIIEEKKAIRDYIFAVMDNEIKYAIRNKQYKYIMQNDYRQPIKRYKKQQGIFDKEELYDLRSDPSERINIIDRHPEIAQMLKEILMIYLNKSKEKAKFHEKTKIDRKEIDEKEIKERLRALGYFEET